MKSHAKLLVWIVLAAVLLTVLVLVSCSKSSSTGPKETTATWTVMLYGAGNNNADSADVGMSFLIQGVQDMEKVGSTTGMNVVAMVSYLSQAGEAYYYHVELHPTENPGAISSPVLDDVGTKDMSNPATLKDFLNYCHAHYPAQHYVLVPFDHGMGWRGCCMDILGGNDGRLKLPELRQAISESDIQHVDMVVFHACEMAMIEPADELKGVSNYMMASQFSMPMQNIMAADLWLDSLSLDRGMTPARLGQVIVRSVRARAEFKQFPCTYALLDLSKIDAVGAALGDLGTYLAHSMATQSANEIFHAWGTTHVTELDAPQMVDMNEFCNNIQAEPGLQQDNQAMAKANTLSTAITAAVPYKAAWAPPNFTVTPRGGIGVYFPTDLNQFLADSNEYVSNLFGARHWQNFVSVWTRALGGTSGGCPATCNQAQTLTIGQAVTTCSLTQDAPQNWFTVTLPVGQYRMQLVPPTGADYDLYGFLQCGSADTSGCSGNAVGPEDFGCNNGTGAAVQLFLQVAYYGGPFGQYQLEVSQASPPITAGPVKKVY